MFGVTFLPVLWSPAGAPTAGVPGPRRSADECDAGWFAPVATRRRSIFAVRWYRSRTLAGCTGTPQAPQSPGAPSAGSTGTPQAPQAPGAPSAGSTGTPEPPPEP